MKLNLEEKTRITTGVYCGCEVFTVILGMENNMSTLNFARKCNHEIIPLFKRRNFPTFLFENI